MQELTQARLKELLKYDPETGVFTWLAGHKMAGKIAGSPSGGGYLTIMVNYQPHKSHRLAWLYEHGCFPSADLDHHNHVRNDNRIDNLRECTNAQNHYNVGIMRTNTSGFKGVYWFKDRGKWRAKITINGKMKHLGYFLTAELASAAYEAKARELHGEFYRAPEAA